MGMRNIIKKYFELQFQMLDKIHAIIIEDFVQLNWFGYNIAKIKKYDLLIFATGDCFELHRTGTKHGPVYEVVAAVYEVALTGKGNRNVGVA